MNKHNQILTFIDEINKSNPIIKDIFLNGSCCNFYFILKSIFNDAEAYFNHDHIITKIDDKFYDINGEVTENLNNFLPINKIYAYKYKNDELLKTSEMYDLKYKQKYGKI